MVQRPLPPEARNLNEAAKRALTLLQTTYPKYVIQKIDSDSSWILSVRILHVTLKAYQKAGGTPQLLLRALFIGMDVDMALKRLKRQGYKLFEDIHDVAPNKAAHIKAIQNEHEMLYDLHQFLKRMAPNRASTYKAWNPPT